MSFIAPTRSEPLPSYSNLYWRTLILCAGGSLLLVTMGLVAQNRSALGVGTAALLAFALCSLLFRWNYRLLSRLLTFVIALVTISLAELSFPQGGYLVQLSVVLVPLGIHLFDWRTEGWIMVGLAVLLLIYPPLLYHATSIIDNSQLASDPAGVIGPAMATLYFSFLGVGVISWITKDHASEVEKVASSNWRAKEQYRREIDALTKAGDLRMVQWRLDRDQVVYNREMEAAYPKLPSFEAKTSYKRFFDSFPVEYRQQFERARSAILSTGKAYSENLKVLTPSGAVAWRKIWFVPVLDDYESIVAVGLLSTDITDQVEISEKFQVANQTLLEERRKRNQLFGMVAHELRTPVAAVAMLADDSDPVHWSDNRVNVQQAAKDLLNTIDDMRLLINPDLKRPVRTEQFDVSELNQSIRVNVESIFNSSGLRFKSDSSRLPDRMRFVSDPYRIRIAVSNLIKNACLHSGGEVVLMNTVSHTDKEQNPYLEWSVEDDGKGIAEADRVRIFEAGERGATPSEGTGLGLHITRSWIEELGGKVWYEPRLPRGSRFIVRVPLACSKNLTSTTERQSDVTDLSALNVLIVEDEKMLRMLQERLISPLVASCKVAANGQDALSKLSEDTDVVITDYFMPEMDGIALASELRRRGYEGVILGLTAATIGTQLEDFKAAGVDEVLPKPLDRDLFTEVVSELLKL